jgi:hypothetical protein
VQPSHTLRPPVSGGGSGATTAISFASVGGGGECVLAQGMSSGHVVIWQLPSSLAAGGLGEVGDLEVLNSILGGEAAGESAAVAADAEDDFVDFTPSLPTPLPRQTEAAEPVVKQQQQQQQFKEQPASIAAAQSSSAADSDGGDSLDGDTPW